MSQVNKAVILCAGHGTRLMPLTAEVPKVMLPAGGRPLLEHHILRLVRAGVTNVYVNLHAHAAAIRNYFGDGSRFGVRIHYAFEDSLRGTAGALNGFRKALNEQFLMQYGDVYSELDTARISAFHERSGAVATLAAHLSSHPKDSDIIECKPDGGISALHHQPGSTRYGCMANAGCYVLEPSILSFVPEAGCSDFFRDVFPAMLRAGCPVFAYQTSDFLFDMGTHDRYGELQARLNCQ